MSLIGPQMNEEIPMAIRTPALLMLSISGLVLNSVAISGVAGSRDVLEKVIASVIQLTTNRMVYLRHVAKRGYFLLSSWLCRGETIVSEVVANRPPEGYSV